MHTLFAPVTVGRLRLRNRFMRSATDDYCADRATGAPDRRESEMYRALAEGGVALIVVGNAAVEVGGRAHMFAPSIADDRLIPLWREVIRPAQEAGARMMLQLSHAGAQGFWPGRRRAATPSGVKLQDFFMPCEPAPASDGEILQIIEAFGAAARRAREAGFDGVQVHAGHGYLVSQFLMPWTNRRSDRWGGDPERRCLFLRSVLEQIRARVGRDYPVWVKLGVAGSDGSGMKMADGARAAAGTAASGADCIEVTVAGGAPAEIDEKSEACYLPLARSVRAAVGADYPLALVGGFRTRQKMEEVLDGGTVQIISMCRPFISEPDLVHKLQAGASEKASCTRCDRCRSVNLGDGVACHRDTGGGITPGEIFQGKARGIE